MIFNVWNPARIAVDEIAFDVTRANTPRMASGDPEWIAACLKAIGVSAAARDWSIEAARCHFYSDYTDEPEWRDRWPDTWIVHVKLNGMAPEDFGPPEPLPKLIEQYDRTWEYGNVDPDHDKRALLLLLFRGSQEDASWVHDQLLALPFSEFAVLATRSEPAGSDWVRLRIVMTGALFPERIGALEEFLQQCRQHNLIVNRNEMDEP